MFITLTACMLHTAFWIWRYVYRETGSKVEQVTVATQGRWRWSDIQISLLQARARTSVLSYSLINIILDPVGVNTLCRWSHFTHISTLGKTHKPERSSFMKWKMWSPQSFCLFFFTHWNQMEVCTLFLFVFLCIWVFFNLMLKFFNFLVQLWFT